MRDSLQLHKDIRAGPSPCLWRHSLIALPLSQVDKHQFTLMAALKNVLNAVTVTSEG